MAKNQEPLVPISLEFAALVDRIYRQTTMRTLAGLAYHEDAADLAVLAEFVERYKRVVDTRPRDG